MYSANRPLNAKDFDEIRCLEECLWRAASRFDNKLMDKLFAPDFFEFGRSGKTYSRAEMMFEPDSFHEFEATIPLPEFYARHLSDAIVQVTYVSEVITGGEKLRGNRSSIWSRIEGGWQLRFHQGTPV